MMRGLTFALLILQNDQKAQFCKICTLAAKEFPETKVGEMLRRSEVWKFENKISLKFIT